MFQQVVERVFSQTISEFGTRVAAFAPGVLAMVLILLVGLVAAGLVHLVVRYALAAVGFDRIASRSGLSVMLQRGGLRRTPSNLMGLMLGWTVLAAFVILAIGALDLDIAVDLLSRAFLYLPQLLIAVAIAMLGAVVAAFLRRTVLIAAVNAGIPSARFLAAGVHLAVMVLVVAMALEHLGVGRQIIVAAFTIVFGGVVFALALAFGLGAQGLARDLLQRVVPRSSPDEPHDDSIRHI